LLGGSKGRPQRPDLNRDGTRTGTSDRSADGRGVTYIELADAGAVDQEYRRGRSPSHRIDRRTGSRGPAPSAQTARVSRP
jgi:hypothetical protein